jgi:hypothetical protein
VTQLALDLEAGRSRKERGLDAVAGNNESFVGTLRRAAQAHALRHGSVTADDVRTIAEQLGLTPTHKNAWGAIFRGRGWERIGERPSQLATNHAHRNPVWAWRGDDQGGGA